MYPIFETRRLLVRKLKEEDLVSFHKMHANIHVMQYVRGKVMTYNEDKEDLNQIIASYDKTGNDFWIYAVINRKNDEFIGTIAFVKDKNEEDEIGYRFLEKYWNNGFGTEIVIGIIKYAKTKGFFKLIACVSPNNIASEKIIKYCGFKFVENYFCEDLKIQERKYKLLL